MSNEEVSVDNKPEAGEQSEAAPASPEALLLAKEQEVAELQEKIKRIAAEADNFRRRQEANFERRLDGAKDEVFRRLLGVVDNLEMAVKAVDDGGSLEALAKGVSLVLKDALRLLESYGVLPIEAEGQAFDPSLHEAVMVEEREDLPDETISAELKKGYSCGERVLRPSMVKVARQPK